MKKILFIAADEWRYWLRSYLAVGATALFFILLIITSVLSAARIGSENLIRSQHQLDAEKTFLAQPDRHPHRMVHYGHYAFRTPAPLAMFDPGLDSVTGQSIFLEGHRQNSAMFANVGASANVGGLSWLTPALIYQLFAPLLIILLGHSAIVREREAGTLISILAQGLNGRKLIAGKFLALLSFIILLLFPLIISAIFIVDKNESALALLSLLSAYLLYLIIWGAITLIAATIFFKRFITLVTLTTLWVGLGLVVPSVAVNITTHNVPLAGKIATDLAMLKDLRKLGDGHNANDPAFNQLQANLFKQYNVDDIKDLPVNFRGLVAVNAEEKLTQVLNNYADMRMAGEHRQAALVSHFGWLTPMLAIAQTSRAISGTDLEHYHRFLRDAETLRFQFVQSLNRAHANKLSYSDDINRGKNEASSKKARVDSSNWQTLKTFTFKPASVTARLGNASQSIVILLIWFSLLFGGLLGLSGKLKP